LEPNVEAEITTDKDKGGKNMPITFETSITPDGKITLPDEYRNFSSQFVRVMLITEQDAPQFKKVTDLPFFSMWADMADNSKWVRQMESAESYDTTPLQYTVALERNEDDGYTATVPALPGCITQGDNIADALANAKEALECHLESMAIDKEAFPSDVREVKISLAETDEVLLVRISVAPEVSIGTTAQSNR